MANIGGLLLCFNVLLPGVAGDCVGGSCAANTSIDDSGLLQVSSMRGLQSNQGCGDGGTNLPGSGSNWCGPGHDPTTPCGDNYCLGSYDGDWACRRHDACSLVEYTSVFGLPVLACSCDEDLYVNRGSGLMAGIIAQVYGPWSFASGSHVRACIAKKGTRNCYKWSRPEGFSQQIYWQIFGSTSDYENEQCDVWSLSDKYDFPFENYGYKGVPLGRNLNSKENWAGCGTNPSKVTGAFLGNGTVGMQQWPSNRLKRTLAPIDFFENKCPYSETTCGGNMCCPRAKEMFNLTYPCPSAEPSWDACETRNNSTYALGAIKVCLASLVSEVSGVHTLHVARAHPSDSEEQKQLDVVCSSEEVSVFQAGVAANFSTPFCCEMPMTKEWHRFAQGVSPVVHVVTKLKKSANDGFKMLGTTDLAFARAGAGHHQISSNAMGKVRSVGHIGIKRAFI